MENNDYFWPAIAALALAVLFPAYWTLEVFAGGMELGLSNMIRGFRPIDVLFLVIGALMIYGYHSFRRQLNDYHNYRRIDVLLIIMMCGCALFHFGGFALHIVLSLLAPEYLQLALTVFGLGCILLFGVIDIVIAVFLLRDSAQLPDLVRMFAIVNLVMGIVEVTILFSFSVIVIFPIALLMLALNFIRKPEVIEFV